MLRDFLSMKYWLTLFSSTASADAKHYEEHEFSFVSEGNRLVGTLTFPYRRSNPANMLAILIHGSGPMDRDETNYGHKPFAVIAHELAQSGIAVVRFDKRGVGKSGGNYDSANMDDFTKDVLAAIDFVKTNLQNNQEKLILIGHSEGGMIAALAANQSSAVDAVVLLAAPATKGYDLLLGQIKQNCRENNLSEEETQAQLDLANQCYNFATMARWDYDAKRRIQNAIDEKSAVVKDQAFLLARINADKLLSRWYQTFLFHWPVSSYRNLKCPVLAVHGLNDRQVIAADHLPAMRAALAESSADYSVVELRGVNHIMQNSPTGATSEYEVIEQTVDPMVLGLIRNFIQRAFVR